MWNDREIIVQKRKEQFRDKLKQVGNELDRGWQVKR